METDVNTNPESQGDTQSDVKTNADAGSEAVKTPAGGEAISYGRFKEVVEEKNELKHGIETLKQQIAELKTTLQPKVEEKEPETWKEVEERATKRAVREIEEKTAKERAAEDAQERAIESQFDHLKAFGEKITPEVKREVLTEMIKTGNGDVIAVYRGVKDQMAKQSKTEQQKQEAGIPNSKSVEGTTPRMSYKQLKGMSLDRVVERVVQGQKSKK